MVVRRGFWSGCFSIWEIVGVDFWEARRCDRMDWFFCEERITEAWSWRCDFRDSTVVVWLARLSLGAQMLGITLGFERCDFEI